MKTMTQCRPVWRQFQQTILLKVEANQLDFLQRCRHFISYLVFCWALKFSGQQKSSVYSCRIHQSHARLLRRLLKFYLVSWHTCAPVNFFDALWQKATAKALSLQVAEPTLPRRRKPPKPCDAGSD